METGCASTTDTKNMKLHCDRRIQTSRIPRVIRYVLIYMYSGADLGDADFWTTHACNRQINWQVNLV